MHTVKAGIDEIPEMLCRKQIKYLGGLHIKIHNIYTLKYIVFCNKQHTNVYRWNYHFIVQSVYNDFTWLQQYQKQFDI